MTALLTGSGMPPTDGGKLINGRKRDVVVDTLGLLLGVMVTAADIGDRTAAHVLLAQAAAAHHLLALVWADGGYTGSLVEYCQAALALVLTLFQQPHSRRHPGLHEATDPMPEQRKRSPRTRKDNSH